jgi:hypothetical protein
MFIDCIKPNIALRVFVNGTTLIVYRMSEKDRTLQVFIYRKRTIRWHFIKDFNKVKTLYDKNIELARIDVHVFP